MPIIFVVDRSPHKPIATGELKPVLESAGFETTVRDLLGNRLMRFPGGRQA